MQTPVPEDAFVYHDATKHHYHRAARALGYMDWDNQPDPFRRFRGAPLYRLPFGAPADSPPYEALFVPGAVPPAAVSADSLGRFLGWSLGLSAWKEYQGARWELRCNPSSGNLHPTEGYVIAPPLEGLRPEASVFHYAPREHGLEQRATMSTASWKALEAPFPTPVFFVGLSSVYWREAWKYGERAYRYCNHDAGHALAALSFSASALGWRVVWLDGLSDAQVAAALGLDREADFAGAEREHADLLAAVVPADHQRAVPNALPEDALARVVKSSWTGQANRLSEDHVEWTIIDDTLAACAKPATAQRTYAPVVRTTKARPATDAAYDSASSAQIFMQRRSAVAMDGVTGMKAEDFFAMLERTLPDPACPPWNSLPEAVHIHLLLFVHRVTEVAPGIYLLLRNSNTLAALRRACTRRMEWSPVPNRLGLSLYRLKTGDCQFEAAQLSCQQAIAGDGAFSLGMLAEFEAPIRRDGPWRYPWLFREAGAVGQVLYLEAEARGVRATGIGCYFDDPVHEALGLRDRAFQSMYHFTVGGAVDDPRLRTLPPYSEERRQQPPGLASSQE